jgi:inner membrane protein
MPTVFTHPVIAIVLTPWFRDVRTSKIVVFIGVIFTVLPDIDVIAFKFGIPYQHMFGHRGFSHSIFFAAVFSAVVAWLLSKWLQTRALYVWLFLFLCMVSHGVLDMLTNGGYGIALLSPFSNERYFFPYQPVDVSTLSIKRFFAGQGASVIFSELKWIWLPSMALFFCGLILKRTKQV